MSEDRIKKMAQDYEQYWLKKAYETIYASDQLLGLARVVSREELEKFYSSKKKWWQFWK